MQTEVPESVFLTKASCCSLRKEGSSWWWLVIPSCLVDLLHILPDLSEIWLLWSSPRITDWMCESLSVLGHLGTENSFCQYGYSICCCNKRPENWDHKKFPSGGKRLVEAMKHYSVDKEWLKPLFRWGGHKGFSCSSESGTVQKLRSSHAAGLKREKRLKIHPSQKLFLVFWLEWI